MDLAEYVQAQVHAAETACPAKPKSKPDKEAIRRALVLAKGEARRQQAAAHERLFRAAAGVDSVYFIRCGDYVKIGRSTNVRARLSELQTGNPYDLRLLATIPGGYPLESSLRSRFSGEHHRGEWFYYSTSVRRFIKDIRQKRSNLETVGLGVTQQ